MEGYKVTIKEVSKEMTARERILFKDTSSAIKLDEAANGDAPLVITPADYAVLSVHNDKSEYGKPDYEQYIIIDSEGNRFVTSSPSFWQSFKDIWDEMTGEGEYSISVYKMDSKNYKGKKFLTCSII